MHVLIATTGVLSPEPVVEFTRHLLGTTGQVTLSSVIEVPRDFIESLETGEWHPLHGDAPSTREQLVERYVEERGRRLTEPVHLALQAASISCSLLYLEGSDPAAAISEAARTLDVDVVVLGATRQIFDRDAWESVSARVMIESGKPVLVVPRPMKADESVED